MLDEASQYRTLRRLFLRRFTEHEFLASGGDVRELLANVFAVLAAFGICTSLVLFRKYVFGLSKAPAAAGSSRMFIRMALLCGAWLVWTVWRRRSAAGWNTLVYEEKPDWQPVSLELT